MIFAQTGNPTKSTVWSEPMNGNVECLIIELFDRGVEILRQDIPR